MRSSVHTRGRPRLGVVAWVTVDGSLFVFMARRSGLCGPALGPQPGRFAVLCKRGRQRSTVPARKNPGGQRLARLAVVRHYRGVTQAELAEAVGVSLDTLRRLELGRT